MDAPARTLHSLLLPLSNACLVLPQATIVEIVPYPAVTRADDTADWLIGVFGWRTAQVPLISFERMCGEAAKVAHDGACVAILYALGDPADLIYYAVELTAIPRPTLLTQASLSVGMARGGGNGVVAADVLISGRRGIIPALEQVEWLICGELAKIPMTSD